jgi:hypothetical protein
MIRNLKALGLALVAVFAMSAVAASAASAQTQGHLTSTHGGAVTLVGEENAGTVNALTAFGESVKCPGSTYTGHEVDVTSPKQPVPNGATEITLTPHYNQTECETSGGMDATVEMHSCDYDLRVGETTPPLGTGTYSLSAKITCTTAGDKIHVGVWAANSSHTEGRLCTIEVGAQGPLNGGHITNMADETLTATGSFTGINVTRHGLCLLDGKGTTTTGSFDLNATVEGESGGVTEGITISDS